MIEKSKEYQFDLCLGFVDYEKAFDRLDHQSLLAALKKQNIDEKYIKIIKVIYKEPTARIHLNDTITDSIEILRGVKQGDPMSPKLFTAALEEAFRNIDWSDKGILVDGEYLNYLRFADDILILSHTPEELQEMIHDLAEESKKVGLNMNIKKTKVMMSNNSKNSKVTVLGKDLEVVEHYVYLGKKITFNNDTGEEIKRRIQMGWAKFGSLSYIFRDPALPISMKRQVFDQCIIPALSYGAETWTTTKRLEKRLRVTERAMERIMIGVTKKDRLTNIDLRQKSGVQDIILTIKSKKWRWAGHLARRHDNRWTHKTTVWTPRHLTRKRGRQSRRWRDDLTAQNGIVWQRIAQDRSKWKIGEEAFLLQCSEVG